MKILHAMSGKRAGGTEVAFERTVTALAQESLEQKVIIKTNKDRRARLEDMGLPVLELPFRTRFDFTSKRRLNSEISTFAPDVIVSWTADVSGQVDQRGAKHMAYIGQEFPATRIQSCDHLFAASRQRVDRVTAAGWSHDRISFLPHIVPQETSQSVDRKEFYTPDTAKLIVFVGGLYPEDSVDTLLEAIARISGLYLWVVGEGPLFDSLQSKALEIGIKPRSRFVGWRHDAQSLIQAADLVVCPARQDDTGTGVLEAWASRKPVIAADSIGPGLLIRHRENGVLVPIDDIRSMAEAIKWVMQDTSFADRIANAGFDTFSKSHSTASVVPEYVRVLKQVAAGSEASAELAL